MALSSSMFAADLVVVSLVQLIYDIIVVAESKKEAEDMKITLLVNKMIFTYVLFALGFVVQMGLKNWFALKTTQVCMGKNCTEDVNDSLKSEEENAKLCLKWICKCACIAYPAMRLSAAMDSKYTEVDAYVKEVEEDDNTAAKWYQENGASGMTKDFITESVAKHVRSVLITGFELNTETNDAKKTLTKIVSDCSLKEVTQQRILTKGIVTFRDKLQWIKA